MKKISLAALISFPAIAMLLTFTGCNSSEEAVGVGISIFVFICVSFFIILGILLFVLWIITLIDCIRRENKEFPEGGENAKTIWLVVLLVTWIVNFWWLVAIIYYFMIMKKKPLKR